MHSGAGHLLLDRQKNPQHRIDTCLDRSDAIRARRIKSEYTMSSAAAIRVQIERFLENRFPAALSPVPRTAYETASTGIEPIDAVLEGGLPVGAISELTGPHCSGRTSLSLAFLAQRTAESRVCAWVDVDDALDPESAAASGVALPQLLWVRCSKEAKSHSSRSRKSAAPGKNPAWNQLDQALRATDLLLQAGGFAAIVLDLGSTAREQASRIPLATWFRFRQAADRTRASLVVLGQAAYAQSSAAVVLECAPFEVHTGVPNDRSLSLGWQAAGDTVLRGFTAQIHRGRERFAPVQIGTNYAGRKPPVSTWSTNAPWEAERHVKQYAEKCK
jgi:recombination protein RecA